jgi:hypothetical protein
MRVINANLEWQGRNRTDAWNRHQTPADSIMLNHLQQHTMQAIIPLKNGAAHIQHRFDGHYEDRIAALDRRPRRAQLRGALVNVQTVHTGYAFVGPHPLPCPLQVLSRQCRQKQR